MIWSVLSAQNTALNKVFRELTILFKGKTYIHIIIIQYDAFKDQIKYPISFIHVLGKSKRHYTPIISLSTGLSGESGMREYGFWPETRMGHSILGFSY